MIPEITTTVYPQSNFFSNLPREIRQVILSFLGPETLTPLRVLRCFQRLILRQNPVDSWTSAVKQKYFNLVKWGDSKHLIQRDKLCTIAAANGQLEILQWARANRYTWDEKTFSGAVYHPDVFAWAWANGCPIDKKATVINAAASGNLEVLKFFIAEEFDIDMSSICREAARNGHLNILKWIYVYAGSSWDRICGFNVWDVAGEKGDLNILDWIKTKDPNGYDIASIGASSGNLEVIKWAIDNRCYRIGPECVETATAAAKGGHLTVLQWLKTQGFAWSAITCSCAARFGHLEVLKWAKENDCPWDERTPLNAIEGGHLEVFKWAIANGCPYNYDKCYEMALQARWHSPKEPERYQFLSKCSDAAAKGDLEAVKAALHEGCPWDQKRSCYQAAKHGHLEFLKWALNSGYKLSALDIGIGAAEGGHLDILKWMQKVFRDTYGEEKALEHIMCCAPVCSAAAKGGHLEVLKWARENDIPWNQFTVLIAAASNGHLSILSWALDNGCSWNESIWTSCARHPHVLKWALESGYPPPKDVDICYEVAKKGDLDILKYTINKGLPTGLVCLGAAENGHLEILKWAVANGCSWNKRSCVLEAIQQGHFEILKWIREEQNYQWGDDETNPDIAVMITYGHFEMLKWARANGCPWDKTGVSTAIAARSKLFEILKYAIIDGAPWKRSEILPDVKGTPVYQWLVACSDAALVGNLSALIAARQEGCPWDEDTCASAAWRGNLDLLKSIRTQGCPWDERTCSSAARRGHFEVLKWARENGCPWDAWTCANAARSGHLEVLKWARENGCPWDENTCAEAAKKDLSILQWARENGCPWDARTCMNAARKNLDILLWAIEKGCPHDPRTVARFLQSFPTAASAAQRNP